MSLVPVDLLVKVIQNTTNDCKAFRLSLLKPKDQSYRPDGLPNQALSVPEIKSKTLSTTACLAWLLLLDLSFVSFKDQSKSLLLTLDLRSSLIYLS